MPTFNCPSCSKKLKTPDESIGKKIACPCGIHLRVPPDANTPVKVDGRKISKRRKTQEQTSSVQASVSQNITVSCPCGKQLLAPPSAVGKAVRCSCGNKVPVYAAGHDHNDVLPPPPSIFGDDEPFGPPLGSPSAPVSFNPNASTTNTALSQPTAPSNTRSQLAPPSNAQVAG